MEPFKDLKQWSLIYFQQKTGSASFSIFLGGPWKWKFRRQKCWQRNRGSRSLTRARNLKSKQVGHYRLPKRRDARIIPAGVISNVPSLRRSVQGVQATW